MLSASDHIWAAATRMPDIAANAICVWCIDLPRIADQIGALTQLLSEDEKARADRFYFGADRTNFVLRRAVLRKIIAGYLCILPSEVAFRYTPSGQPVLDGEPIRDINFSLAHSGSLTLIAVAHGLAIGVDVEFERTFEDMADVVSRYFSMEERREFFALPTADQKRAFYCAWTRKEACLKAMGQGLAFGLHHLTVTLNPYGPARLVSVRGRSMRMSHWSLYSLVPLPGYTGALAVNGVGQRVVCFQRDGIVEVQL